MPPNPIVEFKNIYNKDPFAVPGNLPGTLPATAANYTHFFTAEFPCEVMEFAAVWETASSSGTLDLEKLTGTTAPGSGIALLTSTISTSGTANTVNYGTFVVGSSRQLDRDDRLALKDGGTLTSMVGLQTTTLIKPLGKGHYRANAVAIL